MLLQLILVMILNFPCLFHDLFNYSHQAEDRAFNMIVINFQPHLLQNLLIVKNSSNQLMKSSSYIVPYKFRDLDIKFKISSSVFLSIKRLSTLLFPLEWIHGTAQRSMITFLLTLFLQVSIFQWTSQLYDLPLYILYHEPLDISLLGENPSSLH